MDELLASLDALAAEDLAPPFGPALLERLRPLLAAQNRLAAEVARTVREAEVSGAAEVDGLKSMASWLRGHVHLSTAEAARVVRAGRALAHLPAMAAAFAAGAVTGEQAAVIGRVAGPEALALAAEQHVDVAVIDAVLTGVASVQQCTEVAKAVHHYLDRLDADGPEPDPTEGRRVVIAERADGGVTGGSDLDPVGGEKLQAALEALVQAGCAAGDDRTRAQRQADALVQPCDNQLACGQADAARAQAPGHRQGRPGGPGRPERRPGRGADGVRRSDLRGAGPVAGLRRAGHPHRQGPRRGAAGARPHGAAVPRPRAPGRGGARRGLRVRRLRRTDLVVRRAPSPGAGQRWRDEPGQRRAAVRAALSPRVHHGFRVERQPSGRWRSWRPDGTEIRTGPGRTGAPLGTAA